MQSHAVCPILAVDKQIVLLCMKNINMTVSISHYLLSCERTRGAYDQRAVLIYASMFGSHFSIKDLCGPFLQLIAELVVVLICVILSVFAFYFQQVYHR